MTKYDLKLEFAGAQYTMTEIRNAVKAKAAEQFPDIIKKVKSIGIYMQPETNYIYYTLDGQGSIEQYISFDDINTAKAVI